MPQYNEFARDYHWLCSDHILNGELFIEENKDVLSMTKQGVGILDCSCGIGSFPVALAKRGFKVTGSDASEGMIEQAVSAAATAGMKIPMICSTWEELPNHFADHFEIVFCVGNSICHCRNRDEMLRSLEGMRRVLTKGGKLVIQSRNWEYLLKKKVIVYRVKKTCNFSFFSTLLDKSFGFCYGRVDDYRQWESQYGTRRRSRTES
jgi:2-polyprenyl-3-methyl-5-hydroxy-6-metoxy-1,4-benzoquinol methylase